MIIGVDLGNFATKTSKKVLFDSRVSPGHQDINKDDIKVEYKGKKYTVGNKSGTLNLGADKIHNEYYDICLLTAIAKSFPTAHIEAELVVGLPPEQYDSALKQELKDKLNKIGKQEFIINGTTKYITIIKADVFSESAIPFSNPKQYRDKKTLWVDIGGGSTDVSQFDGLTLVDHITTDHGMLNFYKDMKQKVNSEYKTKFKPDAMEDMLNKDIYKIKGEIKDISFLKDIVQNRVMKICSDINQSFDTEGTEIFIIGGGAEALESYFKPRYNNASVPDDNQFLNAKLYEMVGEMLWGEK